MDLSSLVLYFVTCWRERTIRTDRSGVGKETKGNRWLKCILIEAAWSHLRFCPDGRLAGVFENAYRRKGDKKKAVKIVARKLVNVVWAVWRYEREFMIME